MIQRFLSSQSIAAIENSQVKNDVLLYNYISPHPSQTPHSLTSKLLKKIGLYNAQYE